MVEINKFGILNDEREVSLFSLKNKNGMQADVTNYGAILVNLFVPNGKNELADVNLGYDTLEEYFVNGPFLGATVGPIANRTANGKFEIDGVVYQLDVNENGNNLHSHFDKGMHKVLWGATVDEAENKVVFSLKAADGELGFPGNREFFVSYKLTDDNALEIHYAANSDKDTIINLTNHSYFNLKGHDNNSILDEKLWINASQFTEIVPGAIPTGTLCSVKGTPLDFTSFQVIGERINDEYEQLQLVGGYDHNFVVDKKEDGLEKVAEVVDEVADRIMEVYSDLPGIQFYAGNFISAHKGKNGAQYGNRHGLALETQYFPNSANQEGFARPIVGPGKPYATTTIYKFKSCNS